MTKKENAYEVVMPKLGLIMEKAMLVEWHKGNGEWIDQGELLFSLESDKTIIDIEAPACGYLQILVQAEETVPVMTPVARISADPAAEQEPVQIAAAAVAEDSAPARETRPAPVPASFQSAGFRASPKARQVGRERGISLEGIKGSGPRGMVVVADLDQSPHLDQSYRITPVAREMAADFGLDLTAIVGTGQRGKITRKDIACTVREMAKGSAPLKAAGSASSQLNGLRAVIAERLTDSWNQRPQVTLNSQVDVSALVNDRARRKEAGQSISYNAYLIKACALALETYPQLNVYLLPDAFIQLDQINIGLAVDTERGLMVPVLKNANQKSVQVLNQEMLDLVERTLAGRLLPEEYSGGSFTITNLGALGVDSFSPIINPPESGILGVGRIAELPILADGVLKSRKVVTLSLSFDHRVIDGAPAAEFLQKIAEQLLDPVLLEKY